MREEPDKLMEEIREFLKTDKSKTETLLTAKDAADYLNLTTETLKRWRRKGYGPRFSRLPAVRYRLADIEKFIRDCLDSNSAISSK